MFSKLTTVPVALIAAFALVSPAFAEAQVPPRSSALAECPAHVETGDELVDGAEAAALFAEELGTDNPCKPLAAYADDADDALTAALARIEANGSGSGVAAQVLAALLNGESPAGLGAAHGNAIAESAGEAAVERGAAAADPTENANPPTPAATPAVPPAPPAETPPAIPAVPAQAASAADVAGGGPPGG
jgi:hypothetical protein